MIKLVSKHRSQIIYTRNTKGGDEAVVEEEKDKKEKDKKEKETKEA